MFPDFKKLEKKFDELIKEVKQIKLILLEKPQEQCEVCGHGNKNIEVIR